MLASLTYGQGFNSSFNDELIEQLDDDLLGLIKDADKNIRYIKVLSQEEYNKTEISNNTLYFINDIYDTVIDVTHILDVAVSHTSNTKDEPEQLWILTLDEEMEEVDLWVGAVKSGEFKLIKTYQGFVDGRLTFDGVYEYIKGNDKSSLITKNEPFVVLLAQTNEDGSGDLYGIPSLKYNINDIDIDKVSKIDEDVLTFSVDKGYCSELFKGDDQGIIIAYTKKVQDGYELWYTQYGYPEDTSTVKNWSGRKSRICKKNGVIFSVAVRRLNDYRVGLTYNYWDGDIARAEFIYSDRRYAGIAFHPEYIDIKTIPSVGALLYGAVRNDNIRRVELPTLVASEEPEIPYYVKNTYKIDDEEYETYDLINGGKVKLVFELFSRDPNINSSIPAQKINIQVLNPSNPNINYLTETADINLWLSVINTFNFEDYGTVRDPYFGDNTPAKATISSVQASGNKIYVELVGNNLPMTPFTIVPNIEENDNINIRYLGSDFNNKTTDENNIQIEGWFALSDLLGSSIGGVHEIELGNSNHIYMPVEKIAIIRSLDIVMDKTSIIKTDADFNMNISIAHSTFNEGKLLAPAVISDNKNFNIVEINALEFNFSMKCYGGSNINV